MIGTVIGNYRILEKLGEGGMGSVYKAVDLMLEREVAIKVLNPELARRPDIAERFRTEAVILARLNHSNIATLFGLSRHGDDLFMIMEFVRGESIAHRIKASGGMPSQVAVSLCCQVLDALEYAHQMGVVHRDIKPANLMVTGSGAVKVMDFGIARVLGTQRKTQYGYMVGTLAYMSPEQVRGEDVDGRSDIYSLGAVLYEMLAGQLPFDAPSEYELMMSQIHHMPRPPAELVPGIPAWLNECVLRALAKAAADRFQKAAEFRAALQSGLRSSPAAAQEPRPIAVTRLAGAGAIPAPAMAAKATRAASQGEAPPPAVSTAGLKETRVAVSDSMPTGPSGYATGAPIPPARASGTLFNRLTPLHYAVAAAVLVVLVGAPIVWYMLRRPPALPTPAVSEQRTAPTPTSAPASTSVPAPAIPATGLPASPGSASTQSQSWEAQPLASQSSVSPPLQTAGKKADAPRPAATKVTSEPALSAPSPPAEKAKILPTPTPVEVEVKPAPPPPPPPPAKPAEEIKPASPAPAETAARPDTPRAARPEAAHPARPDVSYKVKTLIAAGDKSKEKDVVFRMATNRLTVLDLDSGETVKEFPYRSISSATYAQSKHPRWKSGLGAAVAVGVFAAPIFFMKGTKHWFTIQTEHDFVVLRLDKDNYKSILPAFETRSGIKVDMEKGDK